MLKSFFTCKNSFMQVFLFNNNNNNNNNNDDTDCNWNTRNNPQRLNKESGGLRNKRASRDHSDNSINMTGQNAQKSKRDL